MPYDKELDTFALVDWGFLDLLPQETKPDWIAPKGKSIEYGVEFLMQPPIEDVNRTVTVFYELKDDHPFEPRSVQYLFNVTVIGNTQEYEIKRFEENKEQEQS